MYEKTQTGGLAVHNIMQYYKSAQLVALGQWWSLEESLTDSCWMEQVVSPIPLKEWLLLDRKVQLQLTRGKSIIWETLAKTWSEVIGIIAPRLSPVLPFYYQPAFAIACSKF